MIRTRHLFVLVTFLLSVLLYVDRVCISAAKGPIGLAIFGADMTLAPSWSFCIDIGRASAGMVSGTMNMAGNLGSFVTGLAFPYLAHWFGSHLPFFLVAAGLNTAAVAIWWIVDPQQPLETEA